MTAHARQHDMCILDEAPCRLAPESLVVTLVAYAWLVMLPRIISLDNLQVHQSELAICTTLCFPASVTRNSSACGRLHDGAQAEGRRTSS